MLNINQYVDNIINNRKVENKLELTEIPIIPAVEKLLKAILGKDFSVVGRNLNISDIRHIKNKHIVKQQDLKVSDFEILPEILTKPTRIRFEPARNGRPPRIVYEKYFGDGEYVYAEAYVNQDSKISQKVKLVSSKTFFDKKRRPAFDRGTRSSTNGVAENGLPGLQAGRKTVLKDPSANVQSAHQSNLTEANPDRINNISENAKNVKKSEDLKTTKSGLGIDDFKAELVKGCQRDVLINHLFCFRMTFLRLQSKNGFQLIFGKRCGCHCFAEYSPFAFHF